MINGVSSTPFSATTLPPIAEATGNEGKVIAVSRERYANKREIVEEKINKWMGSEFHTQAAEVESAAVDQEDLQESLRYRERSTTGTSQQISQTAPLAPHVDRVAQPPTKREEKRPQPRPQPKPQEKKLAQNPVWETVNKLNAEKLTQRVDEVIKKPEPKPEPKSEAKPEPKPETPPTPIEQGTIKPGDTIQFD